MPFAAQASHLRDDALSFVKPTVFLLQQRLQLVDARQRVDLALQPANEFGGFLQGGVHLAGGCTLLPKRIECVRHFYLPG